MGEATAIFGRITTYGEEENKYNLEVISKLPSQTNGYSKFTKEMFNQNMLNGKMDYTIGFARSYKNVESNWEEWIADFEDILLEMKWANVKLIIETEMYGSHQYFWQKKTYNNNESIPIKNPYNLIEKDKWYFGGGHRNFWGMESKLGWKNDFEELRTLKTLSQLLDKSIESDIISEIQGENLKQLKLSVNKEGFKSVLSNLIKMYLDSAEKEIPKYSKSKFEIDNVFSDTSKINIKEIELETSQSITTWISKFVDWLTEQKNGAL